MKHVRKSVFCLFLVLLCTATMPLYGEKKEPKPRPPKSDYADVKVKWQPMFKGVQYAYIEHGGQRLFAAKINAKQKGLSFFVSPTQGRTQTTKDFLAEHGLAVAVNANFFDLGGSGNAIGLAVSEGKVVSGPGAYTSFIIKKDGKKEIRVVNPGDDTSDIQTAVSGDMQIVKDGFPQSDTAGHHGGRHPRTAIGCSRNGRTVFLLVVDGRQKASSGVPLSELAHWMMRLGAYQALNLDGGGSSTFVVRENGQPKVLNNPSAGALRRNGNSIGVRAEDRSKRK